MTERAEYGTSLITGLLERRRTARFKIEVEIAIVSKASGLVKGQTADISESGISAILNRELNLGEFVELDFTLPFGRVRVYAVVRQRSAFRYGFQFSESNCISNVIRPTCRVLAMRQYIGDGI